jgi:hypothetical protein
MADFLNHAFDFYKKLGYAPHQAAAMAGNIMSEGPAGPTQVGDGGLAVGRFQWHPPRQANLVKFAQANGIDPMTDEAQLRFADHELRTTEKSAGDKLFASKDLGEANDAMMHYLRPAGYVPDNPQGGGGYVNRYNLGAGLINQPAMAQVLASPPSQMVAAAPQWQQSATPSIMDGDASGPSGGVPDPAKTSAKPLSFANDATKAGLGLLAAANSQPQQGVMPMLPASVHRGDPRAEEWWRKFSLLG